MIRASRTLTYLRALCVLLPACVVNLSEKNSPFVNGAVTGPAADCSVTVAPGEGAPGGAARIKYLGRYDLTDPERPHFDWSGNSMNARFRGTEVTWGAESGTEIVYIQVVDGVTSKVILGGAVENKTVTVTVPDGEHEITVVRSSEALFSDGAFIPFTFGGGTTLLPPVERPRRIEYIGDSITCGYGNEGTNATCPYDIPLRTETAPDGTVTTVTLPVTENVYLAYGSIAARRLAADATTLCFSGKGVGVNYREQGVGEATNVNPTDAPDPDARTLIPDYYLRTLATLGPAKTCKKNQDCRSNVCDAGLCRCQASRDCCDAGSDAECEKANNACEDAPARSAGTGRTCHSEKFQPWDFAMDQPEPQVVFINLGTNDFSRDINQDGVSDGIDLVAFREAYQRFVDFVRSKRPNAQIFLAVPPMVTDKFPLDNARTNLKNTLRSITDQMNAAGDTKVYSLELLEMGVRYGLGCDYHPNLEVHRIMADQVVGAIASKTCWSTVPGN
ncbi:MAG: Endoglucanase precursor [Labilithrix sp.]|nr:Endoglucanase precursor [Labilithrix sp.]